MHLKLKSVIRWHLLNILVPKDPTYILAWHNVPAAIGGGAPTLAMMIV